VNTKSSQSPYIFTNGPALETGEEESGSRFVRGARRSAACRREARFGLTQRENDSESGLMQFRARNYDPSTGRFTQTDPLRERFGIIAPYVYAFNNPTLSTLVSDSISTKHPKRRILQGQSRAGVILKLKDSASGFDDPAKPKPVLSLYDRFMDPNSSNGQGFRNSISNVTIDVGSGNAGAVALHYFNDNQGTVENVTLRSSDPQKRGKAGLALVTNWPGPALIRNVFIEGFDFGVWSTIGQYSIAFEHLSLEGQRVAGINNSHQMLSIRGLQSKNAVPVMKLEKGLVVLVDGEFSGGTAPAAIENAGSLYARNLRVQGYKIAIQGGGKDIRDRRSRNSFLERL